MASITRLFALTALFAIVLAACGQTPAAQEPAPSAIPVGEPAAPAGTAPTAGGAITIWTKFNDASPQNSQDKWLATMLADLKTTGLVATNINQPYDQINSKLNLAVTAGGDIPAVSYVDSQQLGFYYGNGTLEDLTSYVTSAPWYSDLNPGALKACTGPDGKIYCVPANLNSRLIYYWTSAYPNGFPQDTDAFLKEAERLKGEGKFAMTFKGSEIASAEGIYFSLIRSFGGKYADAEGKVAWASPETAKAVAFVRELFAKKYAPDVALAPGFDSENAMKDGSAGAMGSGSWTYVYLNPLTSPDGAAFDNGATSVDEAAKAGKLAFAPYLAAPGAKPVNLLSASGWAIPKGSPSPELAKKFIDYQMQTAQNADYAEAYGGLPVLASSLDDPRFQSDYWKFVRNNQDEYGQPVDALLNYDRALTKLAETINKLALDPSLDIAKELQAAQDQINAAQ